MAKLLFIVRQEAAPAELLKDLADAGLECTLTADADGVRVALEDTPPEAVLFVLEQRWPDDETRALIRGIKRERNLPIIALLAAEMLASPESDIDYDDFVLSPANPPELVFRLNRLLQKRRKIASEETIECDGLLIDLPTCEVSVDGRVVELTFKEYELLKLLAANRGRVFTRADLLDKIWGYDYFGGDRTVDVHIRRLRSKIEDSGRVFIETVRNIGYRFIKNS